MSDSCGSLDIHCIHNLFFLHSNALPCGLNGCKLLKSAIALISVIVIIIVVSHVIIDINFCHLFLDKGWHLPSSVLFTRKQWTVLYARC